MLNENDMVWLIRQIIGTAELLGQEIKPTAAEMLADDLSSYPRPVLAAALSRVRTEHTGRLTPKAIIDRIDEVMGRPGANEAWAVALTALDERASVVWTDEMAQAWGVAQHIASEGDLVGARMAFIAAYERLVRTARDERRMPSVTVSIGWDAEGRTAAVEKAVQLGYLPQDQAQQYLPGPAAAPWVASALLAGPAVPFSKAPPEVAERLTALRAELAESDRRRARERTQRLADEAADLARRKADAQRAVDERLLCAAKVAA